jgi:hypothetical protein
MMDGEPYTEIWCKAIKEHTCCECYRKISRDEKYQRAKGCWDGEWAEFKTCRECAELRVQLVDEGEAPPFGQLGDYATDQDIDFSVKER